MNIYGCLYVMYLGYLFNVWIRWELKYLYIFRFLKWKEGSLEIIFIMENIFFFFEDVMRISLKCVYLLMCVIMCFYYVFSVIGFLVVLEYMF